MAYSTKSLLTDVAGKPIPQYYDVEADAFLPLDNKVIPEYGWLSTDTPPTPAGFAMGVEIDTIADTMTVKYWNGTAWKAVV